MSATGDQRAGNHYSDRVRSHRFLYVEARRSTIVTPLRRENP